MKKNKWNFILIGLITTIVLIIVFSTNDIEQLKSIFQQANPLWLTAGILCMVLYWLLESLVLCITANSKRSSKLSLRGCIKTTMVGQLFNNLTPFASGGQPIQAYYLTKQGLQLGEATCILLVKFIVYQCTLIIYSGILLALKLSYFTSHISQLSFLTIVGFTVNFVVVLGLISIGFFPKFTVKVTRGIIKLLHKLRLLKNKEETVQKAMKQITEFHDGFSALRKDHSILIQSALFTTVQLTMFFSIPYFMCLALGITNASLPTIIAAGAFVLMVSSFIPLPGASGGAEASFSLFFGSFFPTASMVTVALLLWRFITYYLALFLGVLFCKTDSSLEEGLEKENL